MRIIVAFVALLLVACGGGTSADAGLDAGSGSDAGSATDAGSTADSGVDASTDDDAGLDSGAADAGAADAGARDAGAADAGVADAGVADAGVADAGTSDAGSAADAGISDAGSASDAGAATCNRAAVRFEFLARGPLEVGTLCDEVLVCVAEGSEAARVMAASTLFQCTSSPEAPCTGMTCAYRNPGGPGVLDAAELAEICAVTLVTPTPDLACVVYGP